MKSSEFDSKYFKNIVEFEKKKKKKKKKNMAANYIRGNQLNLILKLIKLKQQIQKHSGKPLASFILTKPLVQLTLL